MQKQDVHFQIQGEKVKKLKLSMKEKPTSFILHTACFSKNPAEALEAVTILIPFLDSPRDSLIFKTKAKAVSIGDFHLIMKTCVHEDVLMRVMKALVLRDDFSVTDFRMMCLHVNNEDVAVFGLTMLLVRPDVLIKDVRYLCKGCPKERVKAAVLIQETLLDHQEASVYDFLYLVEHGASQSIKTIAETRVCALVGVSGIDLKNTSLIRLPRSLSPRVKTKLKALSNA